MQGSDRWQPPDTPNSDEILIRPEPVEDKAEQDQEARERALNQTEATPAFAADVDDVVDDREVQQDANAQEETQKEQHRHRQRFDILYQYRL